MPKECVKIIIQQARDAGNDVVEAIDFEKAERWMLEDAKGYADEIYDDLREEYEHLTSEESFLDYCHANDVEFDVDEEVENM